LSRVGRSSLAVPHSPPPLQRARPTRRHRAHRSTPRFVINIIHIHASADSTHASPTRSDINSTREMRICDDCSAADRCRSALLRIRPSRHRLLTRSNSLSRSARCVRTSVCTRRRVPTRIAGVAIAHRRFQRRLPLKHSFHACCRWCRRSLCAFDVCRRSARCLRTPRGGITRASGRNCSIEYVHRRYRTGRR